MAFANGGRIVTDGLVLSLDAADQNSYNPSENILTYSNDFTNAIWTRGNSSITSSAAISPDGTQNATLIVQDTATNRHVFSNRTYPSTISGSLYTLSFFVKPAGTTKLYVEYAWMGTQYASAYFDFTTKTKLSGILTPSYVDYPNGWTRVIITGTASTSSTATTNPTYAYVGLLDVSGSLSYTGDGTSGAYFYGFQMESNSFATDYKNTTSSPIFRTTWNDLSGNNISSSLINPGFFSFSNNALNFTPSSSFNSTGSYYIISDSRISSLTTELTLTTFVNPTTLVTNQTRPISPRIIESGSPFGFGLGPNNISFEINTGTWTTGNVGVSGISAGKWVYVAQTMSNSTKELKTYVNGVLVNTTTFTGTPVSGGGILIGRGFFGGSYNYNGYVGNVLMYNRALSASEVLQNYNASKSRFNLK
jgi:hypothetical protein